MPRPFEELPDRRLDDLSDEELLGYLVAARAADEAGAVRTALQHLVARHLRWAQAKVALKVPDEHVHDVTHDAVVRAIQAAFDGTAINQFRAWLRVIVQRTIVDFWRGPEGRQLKQDREAAALAGEDDVDDLWAGGGALAEDHEGLVELEDLIAGLLSRLSKDHRDVVEQYVFDGGSAREVAEQTGVSVDNTYKIAQRFRDDLRALLEGRGDDTDEPGPDGPGDTGLPA